MGMRQVAAIIVIILISITSILANKKLDLEIDGGYNYDPPERLSLDNALKTQDETIQKDFLANRSCPLCDASVYSYCDYKIYHDACCCGLPAPQCQFSPCTFLHANSCAEHQLITRCCCYNPYRNI